MNVTIAFDRLVSHHIPVTAESSAELVQHTPGDQPWYALLVDGRHYDLILWKHTLGRPETETAIAEALATVQAAIATASAPAIDSAQPAPLGARYQYGTSIAHWSGIVHHAGGFMSHEQTIAGITWVKLYHGMPGCCAYVAQFRKRKQLVHYVTGQRFGTIAAAIAFYQRSAER
jgi:hypothetical protein